MAYTSSELTTIIERLEAQMGSPAGRERFSSGGTDREVAWSTAKELRERIAYFKDLLATATSTSKTRFIRAITDSGYGNC